MAFFPGQPGHSPRSDDNRRKHGRILLDEVTCDFGDVLDISPSGVRIKGTGFKLSEGQAITFSVKTGEETIEVHGKVAWIRRKLLWFEAGVAFSDISPNTRRAISEIARVNGLGPTTERRTDDESEAA